MSNLLDTVHIVLDVEALDKLASARILSIGAVAMSLRHGIFDKFYVTINTDWYGVSDVFTVDAETVDFWTGQPYISRKGLFGGMFSPPIAMKALATFIQNTTRIAEGKPEHATKRVYGRGPTYDISILEYHYRHAVQDFAAEVAEVPWEFRDIRCLRTVWEDAEDAGWSGPISKPFMAHHALADAEYEAETLLSQKKYLTKHNTLILATKEDNAIKADHTIVGGIHGKSQS